MPVIVLALLLLPGTAAAHGLLDGHLHLNERVPLLLSALLLGAAWLLYILGCRKVRPHGREAWWMHLAMVLTVLAVFGPIDDWAETSTSLHMVQHMLFMIVIAPLWALARPLPQWRAVLGGWMAPVSNAILRSGRYPVALAMLHGSTIWVWHTPSLYMLALDNTWWHAIEHACFLFSAWLFWWSCLRANPRQVPHALMAILLTLMHTGLLGALLTFGNTTFYGESRDLADQQLAGLLMWVPGSLVYLAAAGWISWRWLTRIWRRQAREGAENSL